MISAPGLSDLLVTALTRADPADDPAHLWNDVVHQLALLLDAGAALALRVENRNRVLVAASYCWPTPPGDGPDPGRARLTGRLRALQQRSPRHRCTRRIVPSRMLLEAGFQQSCSTRVTANDRTAGLIGLQYRNQRSFTPDEVGLLDAASRLLGMLLGHGERIRSHARLADHDPLTDLLNRRKGFDVTDEPLDDQRTGTLVLLDLDGFKAVNDTHGHGVGDLVLQVVSQRLVRAVRPLDLVDRLSGDEFIVIVRDADVSETEAIAERLVGHIEQAIPVPHTTVHISASAGITPLGRYPTALDTVGAADSAMYRAKSEGRGQSSSGRLSGPSRHHRPRRLRARLPLYRTHTTAIHGLRKEMRTGGGGCPRPSKRHKE